MENKSSIFGIIALIIGASGLGVGAYSIVNFQVVEGPQGPPGQDGLDGIDGLDGVNGTLDNLVAIWEDLEGIGMTYVIKVSDIKLSNSKYFYMTNDNKYFHLIKDGWYRFVIKFLWEDLRTGVSPVGYYYITVKGNGSGIGETFFLYAQSATHYINLVFYLPSDGYDYYYFEVSSIGPSSIGRYPDTEKYNQLVIEYLGEY